MAGLRARLLALLCLTALVTGCIGERPEATQPAADAAHVPTDAAATVVYEDCLEYAITFYIDVEEAAALLPDGLEPATYESTFAGTPAASQPAAQVRAPVGICTAVIDGEPVGQVRDMYVYIMIEPPEGFALEGADGHSYILSLFTDGPEALAAYRSWGQQAARLGEVTTSSGTPGPVTTGPVTITGTDGDATATFDGTLAGQENPVTTAFQGSWRFVMANDADGITGGADLEWEGEASIHATGQGSFTYTNGDLTLQGQDAQILYAGGEAWTWEMGYTPGPATSNDPPEDEGRRSGTSDGPFTHALTLEGGLR